MFTPMDAVLLSIGNELTLGETVDTNSAWLAQRLAEIGIGVLRHVTVADEIDPIRRQIEMAAADAEVVLITGGLGPTADDLTRNALAAAMGVMSAHGGAIGVDSSPGRGSRFHFTAPLLPASAENASVAA